MIPLVDISVYNQILDWDALNKDMGGVLIKSSQDDWKDSTFDDKIKHAIERNMRIGIWHFYQPDTSWEVQYACFANIWKSLGKAIRPALDVEEIDYFINFGTTQEKHILIVPPDRQHYTWWLTNWLESVEKLTGLAPIVYTRKSYWDQWVLPAGTVYAVGGVTHTAPNWSHYPLWVANYGVLLPKLPIGWTKWDLWQWASDQLYPWAYGPVDSDRYDLAETELDKLLPRPMGTAYIGPPVKVYPYKVRLPGRIYALTVWNGPGKQYGATGQYLINPQCPNNSTQTWEVVQEENGFSRLKSPVGWVQSSGLIPA